MFMAENAMHPTKRISDLLLLGLLLAAATGCADTSKLARFPRGEEAGNLGGASEVVFAPTPAYDGWEYARLDESMNIRSAEEYARDDAQRPGLGSLRRIILQQRSDQVYYYETPRHNRR